MRHIKGIKRPDIILQVDNMVNENSEIYFIDKFIEFLILNDPDRYNRKTKSIGRISFDNKVYLKIYLYSYLNGIRGSRSIEKECKRNIELIWLLENLQPNYWSINNYRKNHKEEIKSMTLEFRKYLKEFEYITDELIAYDGSKIKADADKRSYSLKKLENKLSKIKETITVYIDNSENIDNYEELLLEFQNDKKSFEFKYSKLEGENLELKERISFLMEKEERLNTDKKVIETYIKKKDQKRACRRKFPVKRKK